MDTSERLMLEAHYDNKRIKELSNMILKLKEECDFYKKTSESHRLRYEDSHQHFKDKCSYWDKREGRIQELREENIVLQSEIKKLKSDLENANECYRQIRGES